MKSNAKQPDLAWKKLHTEVVIKTPHVTIEQRDYTLPDKTLLKSYAVMGESDGVTVVAQTSDGKLIAVKQFRAGIEQVCLDLPGGAIDGSAAQALAAAKRELLEETGYASEEWEALPPIANAAHRLTSMSYGFLATNCQKVAEPTQDETECLALELLTPAQFEELIYAGKVLSAGCVATYFQAKHAFFSRDCDVCVK